ncbi:MAG: hypothetical protein R3C68_09610 [Myxococcota bacterium]
MPLVTLFLFIVPSQGEAFDALPACGWPDIGVLIGANTTTSSTGGHNTNLSLGANTGWDFNACRRWPLRIEAQALVTRLGSDGVDAVHVSSRRTAIDLLTGPSFLVKRRKNVWGLELLAGPELRGTRVSIRVRNQRESTRQWTTHGHIAGGGFWQVPRWRLTLRGA